MGRGRIGAVGALALATVLAGCAPSGDMSSSGSTAEDALEIRFEDVLAPDAFQREGPARVDASDSTAGFWAVAPGLQRPERGLVERLDTGAKVVVALYQGRGGSDGVFRLSGAAAEALGIGSDTVQVRATSLRREPVIAAP